MVCNWILFVVCHRGQRLLWDKTCSMKKDCEIAPDVGYVQLSVPFFFFYLPIVTGHWWRNGPCINRRHWTPGGLYIVLFVDVMRVCPAPLSAGAIAITLQCTGWCVTVGLMYLSLSSLQLQTFSLSAPCTSVEELTTGAAISQALHQMSDPTQTNIDRDLL